MYKTISSRLTAHFQPDGGHLQHYLSRKSAITKSLCEDLILNDQVLIPTADYLTAAGLVSVLGERPLIHLLERERIKFVRTRNVFGYVRGSGIDGALMVFRDPNNQRPQDSSIESSVAAGLSTIEKRITEKQKLSKLIVSNSLPQETAVLLDGVRKEAIADLKQSQLWQSDYLLPTSDLLALPGMDKMQVRVIGSRHDPKTQIVDTLLSLVLYNSDLFLADHYGCQNISSFCPIGDLIDLKTARLTNATGALWDVFEAQGIPDLSLADFSDSAAFAAFEKVVCGPQGNAFRSWFNSQKSFDRVEVMKEYVRVLQEVSWISRLPTKIFRFVATTAVGLNPIAGVVAGAFDTFVIERFFRRKSPKFFVDDFNKISGLLMPKQGANHLRSN